jgi:hypothetical protein
MAARVRREDEKRNDQARGGEADRTATRHPRWAARISVGIRREEDRADGARPPNDRGIGEVAGACSGTVQDHGLEAGGFRSRGRPDADHGAANREAWGSPLRKPKMVAPKRGEAQKHRLHAPRPEAVEQDAERQLGKWRRNTR